MSMFNPDTFLDQETVAANDTSIIPCPVGDYPLTIVKLKPRPWAKRDDPTVNGVALDVTFEVNDEEVKVTCQRDKVTVKMGVMLDMTDDGKLDEGKGKNVALGRLREAVSLNNPGEKFSFNMLLGRMLMGRITHRADGEDIFPEVKAVTKL